MKQFIYTFTLVLLLAVYACKKDPAITVKTFPPASYPFACEDTSLDWTPFKPDPFGLVYHETISSGDKGVWRVAYDPTDANILYYITLENGGANNLYKLNRSANSRTLLDNGVLNDFDISKTGWIAYQKIDLNIYIAKSNGDSIHAITTKGNYFSPAWANDGRSVYIYDGTQNPAMELLISKEGTMVDTLKTTTSGLAYNMGGYLYYTLFANGQSTIHQQNTNTQDDKLIVTDNTGFYSLFVNKSNTVLYYTNQSGLYSVNLFSLGRKKIINSGYGSRSLFHHFTISNLTGEFAAAETRDFILASDTNTIIEDGNMWEFSSDCKCRHQIILP